MRRNPQQTIFPKNITSFSFSRHNQKLQRNCHSSSQIKVDKSVANSTITQYQSIRELKRKMDQSGRYSQNSQKQKGQLKVNSYRKIQHFYELNGGDAMEVIKVKLHENDRSLRVKTQYTINRHQYKNYLMLKKTSKQVNQKQTIFQPSFKSKKLDLLVRNTKAINASILKRQNKFNEIFITLKDRPNTAIQNCNRKIQIKPTRSANSQLSISVFPQKNEFLQKQSVCKQYQKNKMKEMNELQNLKDISGWEVNSEQDIIICQQQQFREKKKKTYKRK